VNSMCKAVKLTENNCGVGSGGFEPGNSCAAGGGASKGPSLPKITMAQAQQATEALTKFSKAEGKASRTATATTQVTFKGKALATIRHTLVTGKGVATAEAGLVNQFAVSFEKNTHSSSFDTMAQAKRHVKAVKAEQMFNKRNK